MSTLSLFEEPKTQDLVIYTDGACLGNPGPGGLGLVIIEGESEKQFAEGYKLTTNNRMEIMAAVKALYMIGSQPRNIKLYSDSNLLVAAHKDGWLRNWQRNNWRKSDKKPVLNRDLWEALLEAEKPHRIEYIWVKGHANNHYNEICDKISREAAEFPVLKEDVGYQPV